MKKLELKNAQIAVTFTEDEGRNRTVYVSDGRPGNIRRAKNKGDRDAEKAFEALQAAFTEKTTFHEAVDLLEDQNLRMDVYIETE